MARLIAPRLLTSISPARVSHPADLCDKFVTTLKQELDWFLTFLCGEDGFAQACGRVLLIVSEEARYSRRVSMEEIAARDFNLNISRYISTAVAEEEIDLGAVNAELVSLEQKIEAATEKHNAFLKELGLRSLP